MENSTIKNINDLTAFLGCDDMSDIVETVYNRAKGGVFVVLQDNGIALYPDANTINAEADGSLLYPFTAKQYDDAVKHIQGQK
jgi:hypothetical protein